jgi:hypothetical protein
VCCRAVYQLVQNGSGSQPQLLTDDAFARLVDMKYVGFVDNTGKPSIDYLFIN